MLSWTRLTIRRAKEERVAQVAAGLAFATVLSVVPLLAVAFALFARFPVFRRFENAVERHLLAGLLPPDISRTVLKYLSRFAENAHGLTWLGSLFVLLTAIAMLMTVENAFNRIWEVKRSRPFGRRIALSALVLAVGLPLLGIGLWATSHVLGASAGLVADVPPSLGLALELGPLALGAAGWASLYYFVPNTEVRRRHAFAGGVLAAVAFELGKRGFAAYLLKVPTYKTVYGAFAVLPLFLLWVYFSWLVVLSGALVAAGLHRAARTRRP